MILYGSKDIHARNQGEEYKCIMVYGNEVTTSDWSDKWIRAYALNYWLYVFLALFNIVGILGACMFTLRLVAWCSICVMNPIHLIVVVYTTIVRYNEQGRACSLNEDNTEVFNDSNFLQWTIAAQWFGMCFFCGVFNLQTEMNKRYSD